MANALYTLFKKALEDKQIALLTDSIKVALVTSAYVPNLATDQFQSAIVAATLAGTTDQAVTSPTDVGGKFSHAPVTWTAVPNGEVAKYLVYYDSAPGSAGANPLIACIDTTTGVTLPVTANGGNITYTPDAANGVFSI